MARFTFKEEKATGKFKSFEMRYFTIKLEKKKVGNIREQQYYKDGERYSVSLAVKETNNKCGFKWIVLLKKFNDPSEAKEYLNSKCDNLIKQFDLFKFED